MAPEQSALPTWAGSAAIPLSPRAEALEIAAESIADLETGELLGKGRFKQVHRGTFRGRDVAILNYASVEECDMSEIRMLQVLADASSMRYVPEVYGICAQETSTVVLQERAVWGSLKSALKDPQVSPRLTGTHLAKASFQLAAALAFLQQLRIVHADLSCRNLLLCKLADDPVDITIKVTDFGLALFLPQGQDSVTFKQPQATRWCAPETVAHLTLSHRADVWSYATTVWEMFSGGSTPWIKLEKRMDVGVRLKRLAKFAPSVTGRTGSKIGPAVPSASGRRPDEFTSDFPKPSLCPAFVYAEILACLQVDEFKRPSFVDIAKSLQRHLPVDLEDTPPRTRALPSDDEPMEDEQKEMEPFVRSRITPSTGTPVSSCSMLVDTSPTPPRPHDRCCEDVSQRIKALEEFLWSDKALEALGEEAVFEMRMEVETARARDMFLSDRKQRQDAGRTHVKAYRGDDEFVVPRLSFDVCQQQEYEEYLGPCWSLWSYSGGVMDERRYASDREAWEAFYSLRSTGAPCVLRDPLGAELAALSWVTMPSRLLQPLRLCR